MLFSGDTVGLDGQRKNKLLRLVFQLAESADLRLRTSFKILVVLCFVTSYPKTSLFGYLHIGPNHL